MIKSIKKFSHTQSGKNNHKEDKCPVCSENLYYDEEVTRRIGIIARNGDIDEWKCPFCESEFDLDNNILYIYGSDSSKGIT